MRHAISNTLIFALLTAATAAVLFSIGISLGHAGEPVFPPSVTERPRFTDLQQQRALRECLDDHRVEECLSKLADQSTKYSPALIEEILRRIEEKKFQAARQAQEKAMQDELVAKRISAGHIRSPGQFAGVGWAMDMCHGYQYQPACDVLEELDVTMARLEAQGWAWNPRTKQYEPAPKHFLF
jgi:hypothetical protein